MHTLARKIKMTVHGHARGFVRGKPSEKADVWRICMIREDASETRKAAKAAAQPAEQLAEQLAAQLAELRPARRTLALRACALSEKKRRKATQRRASAPDKDCFTQRPRTMRIRCCMLLPVPGRCVG
jgi:septal ring factor EnvC (AmiA/AmiB activator)